MLKESEKTINIDIIQPSNIPILIIQDNGIGRTKAQEILKKSCYKKIHWGFNSVKMD